MTLKELSIELGKPAHSLANTLRQVGLAEVLMNENDELSSAQEARLRSGSYSKSNNKGTQQNLNPAGNVAPYSIADLANKLDRGLADMVNIVKMSRLMSDTVLSGNTILPKNVWDSLETRLKDRRINLITLAKELGIDAAALAKAAYESKLIDNSNPNQKLDKQIENTIRKFFQHPNEAIDADLHMTTESEDAAVDAAYERYVEDHLKYNVCKLAKDLNVPEDRIKPILNAVPNGRISSQGYIETATCEYLKWVHDIINVPSCDNAFRSVINEYELDKWNMPVEKIGITDSYFGPGKVVEGKISGYTQEGWEVTLERQPGFKGLFSSIFGTFNEKTEVQGFLPNEEWDWELVKNYRNSPRIGDFVRVLIIKRNCDKFIVSRRRLLESPKVTDRTSGQFLGVFSKYILFRSENGAYGLIPQIDLIHYYQWRYDWDDICGCNLYYPKLDVPYDIYLKPSRTYEMTFNGLKFQYYLFRLDNEVERQKALDARYRLQGFTNELTLDKFVTQISTEDDLEQAQLYNKVFLATVEDTNFGGYVMHPVDNSFINLFCPYSLAPAWINKNDDYEMLGCRWLVKIQPSANVEYSTIVSAKLEKKVYKDTLVVNGYYREALICSQREKSWSLLINGTVPATLPRKLISWDSCIPPVLQVGDTVPVKIISYDENNGFIASIRDVNINPWEIVRKILPEGTIVEAHIIEKKQKSIILSIGQYKAILPADKISWMEYINDCSFINLNEDIDVAVMGYDDTSKSIIVSLRDITPDPWTEIDKHIPLDSIVTSEITELTNNGAWLKVGKLGFKGYLSYRDVDWCRYVDKDRFSHHVGEFIEVKVIRRNTARRQLTCSLKALIPNPWERLSEMDSIKGLVLKIEADQAFVRLENGIECVCKEALSPELEGQTCNFDILTINVASQQLSISYRKHEIKELNISAIGDMFKEFRSISNDEKVLTKTEFEEFRDFTIKEVSSTGRVSAIYAEDDDEYDYGILLPGAVTINRNPVNVIFARWIIKKHMIPGNTLTFRVTHRYDTINYAVLAIDASSLIGLDHIATDDMSLLTSPLGINARVLNDLTTPRNVFVEWRGYMGYISRDEISSTDDDIPETLRVKAIMTPLHPEQMIRFIAVNEAEALAEREDEDLEKEIAQELDSELSDCYRNVTTIEGFNPQLPDYYPLSLQIRYDRELFQELDKLLSSDPNFFTSQTFFLDCYRNKKGQGHIVSIFNSSISIQAFCSDREEGDEIQIKKCIIDPSETPKIFAKPLRISGEKIQIVPLNSSALPPASQDAEIIEDLLLYNREVLPELRKLTHGNMAKRGEHYLTLKEMLKLDIEREKKLSKPIISMRTKDIREDAGTLGGLGIVFGADEQEFDSIRSKDDSQEGFFVYIKPYDSSDFDKTTPAGRLSYLGKSYWRIDLYKDKDIDIDALKKFGIQIKRRSNVRHLNKQICAIDDFVFERNGLDIFSKIVRNKLKPIITPPIEEIEANNNFRLYDSTDSQANALKMALGGSEITLIQGPPGTGKSTVIVDIIRNLVKQHKKVLVCTQSVAPIEELYFKLSGRRKGKSIDKPKKAGEHPLRCAYLLDDESIEISSSVEEKRNTLKEMRLLINRLRDVNSSATPSAIERLKQSKEFFEKDHKEECRRVVSKFATEIAPRHEEIEDVLSEYIKALDKEDVENFASEQKSLNLEAVDVVFGTCIGVGVSRLLADIRFDTLIIDEAGKANYAESLVPMMMANEYILVGDDQQLPPYTNSELVKLLAEQRLSNSENTENDNVNIENEKSSILEDVGKSLFGDLKPRLPASNQIMLSKQFRMHPAIGNFVSKLFYNGKVDSARTASECTLNIKGLEEPIIFVDTSGMGSEARETRQGMSLYNDGEILAIKEELLPMLKSALDAGASIGILSPYGAQVNRMRQQFPELRDNDHERIFTIDSIQGEEYDVVVFSFVRNTRFGSLNFVDDLRRLNVSFSRAKCNLILVGHLDTLKNEYVHKVDHEAVMAVYNEIQSKRVKTIAHHGAMQCLYNDFPPKTHPLIQDLDEPYWVFEDCRPTGKPGEFTVKYGKDGGKLLTLFNPTLQIFHKKTPKDEWPQSFKASLIGFVNDTPYTVVEPMGLWLQESNKMKSFEFSATIFDLSQSKVILQLHDLSFIALPVPRSLHLSVGSKVKVIVRNYNKFTLMPIEYE